MAASAIVARVAPQTKWFALNGRAQAFFSLNGTLALSDAHIEERKRIVSRLPQGKRAVQRFFVECPLEETALL